MKRCDNDNAFGPALGPGPDCHNFDFTLLFEDSILSLVPSIVFILVCIFRTYSIFRISKVISWPLGRTSKIVSRCPIEVDAMI